MKQGITILKFGGSSIGDPDRVKKVSDIVLAAYKKGPVAVVVSAFQGVTDRLIEVGSAAAKGDNEYVRLLGDLEVKHEQFVSELIASGNQDNVLANVRLKLQELRDVVHGVFLTKELTGRTLDFILSFGERLSAYIISECIRGHNLKSEFLDARNIIRTDDNFSYARVDFEETYRQIRRYFEAHDSLQVVTGFIASTKKGETTTLGRGGSDYTASILGAALKSPEIQIWTDVDGAMTADPRKVREAFSIENMTYVEAVEISHFGAKVIYPPTMEPASRAKIPIVIKNTFNPSFRGTLIGDKQPSSQSLIMGLASISSVSLLRIQGSGLIGVADVSSRLFASLAKEGIKVILITQASSEHSISFAVLPEVASKAKKAIEGEFEREITWRQMGVVVQENDLAIIAVVGENIRRNPKITEKLFETLGKEMINVVAIAQGSSELNISVVVSKGDEIRALNAIHHSFFSAKTRNVINVFLVGTGLIGGALLKQINNLKNEDIEIYVAAIANAEKMIFNSEGIVLNKWFDDLASQGEKFDINKFVAEMKKLNLRNSVFVDCTASEEIAKCYEDILKSGISVVTPNKKANSSDFKYYRKIRTVATDSGARFLYETNVGAGLPIISTLRDLLSSGDKINKIEAILSGSLSYIFNNFTEDRKFSEVVKEAKEKGYTEPDPHDDLSGVDVQRKILILAREIGLKLEMKDVAVESVDKNDKQMNKRINSALKKGNSLRYIATLEKNRASVALKEVGLDHSFYFLRGSDNIISFTTENYCDTPLVIKGPGAGAAVTAAGVLADIIKTKI